MTYRILRVGAKWQAQIKGAHNWIPLQDSEGNPMLHDTEHDARCEINGRMIEFGAGTHQHKQKKFVAQEV